MIKKALLPALVLAAASVAVPAMAQSHGPARQSGLTISVSSGPAYGQAYGSRPVYNQPAWQSINRRQASLDRRIDVGVRNGSLTRREAAGLRREFSQIARLEANYRRNGLTQREMADLDRRFDRLSMQIRAERNDRQTANGRNDHHDRYGRR